MVHIKQENFCLHHASFFKVRNQIKACRYRGMCMKQPRGPLQPPVSQSSPKNFACQQVFPLTLRLSASLPAKTSPVSNSSRKNFACQSVCLLKLRLSVSLPAKNFACQQVFLLKLRLSASLPTKVACMAIGVINLPFKRSFCCHYRFVT